ncbi:MAG: PilZ domain-containing protein [Bryobacteraceae bacterium]|jgi:hypothetical protein
MSVRSEPAVTNRRAKLRFDLACELRYRVVYRGKVWSSGVGRTIDMSSGSVAFFADSPLRRGARVELSITWPALLDAVCPMQLSLAGRIIRSDGRFAVCKIGKHEFRTQGRKLEQAAGASGALVPRWAPASPSGVGLVN